MRNYAIRPLTMLYIFSFLIFPSSKIKCFTRVFRFLTKLYFRFTLTTKFDGGNTEKLLLLLKSYGFYVSRESILESKEILEKFILIRCYIENV